MQKKKKENLKKPPVGFVGKPVHRLTGSSPFPHSLCQNLNVKKKKRQNTTNLGVTYTYLRVKVYTCTDEPIPAPHTHTCACKYRSLSQKLYLEEEEDEPLPPVIQGNPKESSAVCKNQKNQSPPPLLGFHPFPR